MRTILKAVIPIAGRGSRMGPWTNLGIPKALLPVIQRDLEGRSVVLTALEVLVRDIFAKSSGVKELCLVVAEDHLPVVNRFVASLGCALSSKIVTVIQTQPFGFGHAVLQSREFVGDEPFFVLLGDHLYTRVDSGGRGSDCLAAMQHHYQSLAVGSVLTGVGECMLQEANACGLLSASPTPSDWPLFRIKSVLEKPLAGTPLRSFVGMNEGSYLCNIGIDIVPPTVFQALDCLEKRRQESGTSLAAIHELGFREALGTWLSKGTYFGLYLDNYMRHDFGNPAAYSNMLQHFGEFPIDRSTD